MVEPAHDIKGKSEQDTSGEVRIRRSRSSPAADFVGGFRLIPRFIPSDTAEHLKSAITEGQAATRSAMEHLIDCMTKQP
jgi:hypothetical protein